MAVSYGFAQPPAWIEEFQRNLLQGAYDKTKDADPAGIAKQGIAGFQPLQEGAIAGTAGLYGIDPKTGLPTGTGAAFDPYFTQAQQDIGTAKATTAMGIPSLQAAQGQYDPSTSNYQQFFNQYQTDVTKEALKQMDEQAAIQKNQLQDQAQQAGAFGGSRMAVQEAELDKNIMDIKSRRIFQDLAQNFQQAQDKAIGTYESAAGRRLQSAPVFGQIGAQQANLGAQQFGMQQQGLGSLFTLGGAEQAQQQQGLNEIFRQQQMQRQEPYRRMGFFSDIMGGIPSYQQTMQQKTGAYTNPLLGAIGAGLGTYGVLSGGNPAGAFGMGS
tara:strand:- start:65 stop:1042 length:978 start_codon:yes stop_codon:yes gene_type:complete